MLEDGGDVVLTWALGTNEGIMYWPSRCKVELNMLSLDCTSLKWIEQLSLEHGEEESLASQGLMMPPCQNPDVVLARRDTIMSRIVPSNTGVKSDSNLSWLKP